MTQHALTRPEFLDGEVGPNAVAPANSAVPVAAWGAVLSMALCVAVLIASEFMPVSLLSPIASELGVTEGQAGQAISISGIFAVLTSLLVAGLTRRLDRRLVLASFSLILVISGTIVTFAPNYLVLMVGRALLGVAIGGFWSMSTSIVMRLVPEESVPKGLAMLNAGNAIAATIAAPLGSLLGSYIGWRGAFFAVVPLAPAGARLAVDQPAVAATAAERGIVAMSSGCLRRPQVAIGMALDHAALHGPVRAVHLSAAIPGDGNGSVDIDPIPAAAVDGACGCRRDLSRQPSASEPAVSPFSWQSR